MAGDHLTIEALNHRTNLRRDAVRLRFRNYLTKDQYHE